MLNETDISQHIDNHLKPWLDAGRILKSGYLTKLGLNRLNSNIVNAIGECIQHSAPAAPPHRVKIALQRKDGAEGYRILSSYCPCIAGDSGKCKHAVAVMRSLIDVSEEDMEVLSCTDDRCAWIKGQDTKVVQGEILEIKKVTDFCHYTRDIEPFPVIPDYFDSPEYKLLTEGLSELRCSFLRHRKGVSADAENISASSNPLPDSPRIREIIHKMVDHDSTIFPNVLERILALNQKETDFFMEKVQLNTAQAIDLCCSTVSQSACDEWKRARKVRLTGYKCYELSTYLYNKNPAWDKKLQGILLSNWKGNANTEFGNKYEQVALNIYEKKYNRRISYFGIVVNVNVPYMGFSPDGIVFDDTGSIETARLLEVKCPKAGRIYSPKEMMESLDYIIIDREARAVKLKERHAYYGQIQLAMALSGIKKADLILYHHKTKNVIVVNVPYDEEFAVKLIESLTDVYFTYGIPFLLKNVSELM